MSIEKEPAFPITLLEGESLLYPDGTHKNADGLTKLEYFAGLAMQGMLASGAAPETRNMITAVDCAKALMAELEKSQ